MTTLLPALVVAFTGFCLWLTLRIVNRRERWAKWTLACVVGLPLLYIASIGPACWISSRLSSGCEFVSAVYSPIFTRRLRSINRILIHYSEWGSADRWRWYAVPQLRDPYIRSDGTLGVRVTYAWEKFEADRILE